MNDYYILLTFLIYFLAQESKNEIFGKINSGKWLEVLESENFTKFLLTGDENFEKYQKLGMAVACLMAYVQDNFTGPDLIESCKEFRLKTVYGSNQERWSIERISIDGIELNPNVRHIPLLIISRNFLEDLYEEFPADLVSSLIVFAPSLYQVFLADRCMVSPDDKSIPEVTRRRLNNALRKTVESPANLK